MKRLKPLEGERAPVQIWPGVHYETALPYPFVHYTSHGGFLGFAEDEDVPPVLCECSKVAFQNLLTLNVRFPQQNNNDRLRLVPADSWNVPRAIAEFSAKNPTATAGDFPFEPKLCHRCNGTLPTPRFCHEMYGGAFKQRFGWYIRQTWYRHGMRSAFGEYLPEVLEPPLLAPYLATRDSWVDYQALKDREIKEFERLGVGRSITDECRALEKAANKHARALSNTVENIAREEFGFAKVGDSWVNETMLFGIVRRLFPDGVIHRHHRPDWLRGLELDVFVPGLGLGFEYQGQQHFRPVKAWGGERALRGLQERDVLKRRLCLERGVALVEVDYTEALSDELVRGKIEASRALGSKRP